MTAPLAERIKHVGLSPTMKGTMEAERLRRSGVEVIDLGAGEPDFPTPDHVEAAAHAALHAHFTKYTSNNGMAELREAVAWRYQQDYGVSYALDEVIMTAGGKQACHHAALAAFGPGDEVILHAPWWPTLGEQVKLAGATPVVVRTHPETGFAILADDLLAAVTPRTRGIILNSPCNPTGTIISEAEAATLARGAAERGLWIVIDLCYERLIYDALPHNLPKIFGEVMRDRLLLAGSMSKTYAMTGWRCGWLVGPKEAIKAANALQSHETSNVNSITQKASIAALTGPQQCVDDMLAEYKRRRDQMSAWLAEEPRLRMHQPQGAFYLFVDISEFLTPDRTRTSMAFTDALLQEEHVVMTPGEAFDTPGFVRISYAASDETLREGATRLIRFARQQVAPAARA
ncbi:MAG TPA: pyridoxal phosphate-dependent aminotransferase [Vicinamibacterales bacterium]|nr:pyridoxal phosphate-dependent aminotransferase [Vicinamibacterales bacterium]